MKPRAFLNAALISTASILAIGVSFGCNRSGARLRDAASEDLNCPPKQVRIIGASRTKDVSGCGQRATYKFEDGDWVMVSREGLAPAGAQPKAAPPAAAPLQPAAGTPSMPPSSPPPPPAPGQKAL